MWHRTLNAVILDRFTVMLESVGSDLAHISHINIFLKQMSVFEAMNAGADHA